MVDATDVGDVRAETMVKRLPERQRQRPRHCDKLVYLQVEALVDTLAKKTAETKVGTLADTQVDVIAEALVGTLPDTLGEAKAQTLGDTVGVVVEDSLVEILIDVGARHWSTSFLTRLHMLAEVQPKTPSIWRLTH